MNHSALSESELPILLGIGLPPEVADCLQNDWKHDTIRLAATLDEARRLIEQRQPQFVIYRAAKDDVSAGSVGRLRRWIGDTTKLVLLVEGSGTEAAEQAIFEAGADDLFVWPAERNRLAGRLRRLSETLLISQRNRTRARQLADDLERYQMAFHGSDDGLWDAKVYWPDWFDDNNEIWFSTRFKSLLGFEDDEFPNRLGSWKRQVHPEDAHSVYEALDAHLHQRQRFDIEYRVYHKSGRVICLRGLGLAHWDRNGIPTRMAGSIRDITNWKEAVEERDLFFQHSIDLFCYADLEGTFIRVNPAFTRVLGYSPEELVSRPYVEFVHPDDRERTRRETKRLQQGFDTIDFENRYLCKDGGYRWLAWRVPAPPPGKPMIFAVARDITQQKLVEASLNHDRQLLCKMIDIHEQERRLFSFEIHDAVVQQMTAALMHLESGRDARKEEGDRAERELRLAGKLLGDAVDEARRVITGLRPTALDDLGLVHGVAQLVEQAGHTGIEILYDPDDDLPDLAKPLEDTLFRVAQEGLNNAVRHSKTNRIEVLLYQEQDDVVLQVRDWGIGFNPDQIPPGHFGVEGMRERCRLLEAELSIRSIPDEGTTITGRFQAIPPITDEEE